MNQPDLQSVVKSALAKSPCDPGFDKKVQEELCNLDICHLICNVKRISRVFI